LVLLPLLFAALGILVAFYRFILPISWTADYDKDRYTQIRSTIDADQQHLLGKSLDEVTTKLSLKGIPWDDVSLQEPLHGQARMYHFRGFAFLVELDLLPRGLTPQDRKPWASSDLDRGGVLWLARLRPYVRIDGISDPKERMQEWRKAEHEESERGSGNEKRGAEQR
jgi:hypothetical protein